MLKNKDKVIQLGSDGPFNYVLGLLRGSERQLFMKMMNKDSSIEHEVHFWEESLIPLLKNTPPKEAYSQTWQEIVNNISEKTTNHIKRHPKLSDWIFSGVLAASILVCALLVRPQFIQVNADYVAVLTNEAGSAQLTVLTSDQGKSVWLEWEKGWADSLPDESAEQISESSFQLWAVSRRDGEFRSLAVFNDSDQKQFDMREYHWRLIRDADYLLLTKEEKGGSPFNEPSDQILARGVCVRLNKGA